MIRMLLAIVTLTLAPAAFAAETVMLKTSPEAQGDTVTLGDVFDGAGAAASTALVRAPEHGAEIAIEAQWLRTAAARAGLRWDNPAGLARVRIGRAGQTVGPDAIAGMIAAELDARAPGRRHMVTLTGAPELHAPLEAEGRPAATSLDYQERTGAVSALVAPYPGGAPVRVTGRVEALAEAPALVRNIGAGERITAADIVWVEVKANRLPADAIMDPASIDGQEAKRTLRAGEPLRRYDLKVPAAIQKGELVTVYYVRPGLTLAARAKALEEAPVGAALRVLNLQSNRVIEVVAEGPGRARVDSPRQYAAAAQQGVSQ